MTKDQFDYEVMRELHEIEDAQHHWEHRKDMQQEANEDNQRPAGECDYDDWPEHKRPGYAERIAEQAEYLRKREREEKLIRSEK